MSSKLISLKVVFKIGWLKAIPINHSTHTLSSLAQYR
jgi:hypothetical protein